MVSTVGFQMLHIFSDVFYHSSQYFSIGLFFVVKEIPKTKKKKQLVRGIINYWIPFVRKKHKYEELFRSRTVLSVATAACSKTIRKIDKTSRKSE